MGSIVATVAAVATMIHMIKDDEYDDKNDVMKRLHSPTPPFVLYFRVCKQTPIRYKRETNRLPYTIFLADNAAFILYYTGIVKFCQYLESKFKSFPLTIPLFCIII